MRRTRWAKRLPLLIALTSFVSFMGSGQTVRLANNVDPWVRRAQVLGPADDSKQVRIAAYLSFRNQSELQTLARDVSTPGSSKYHQFLTPEQFHAAFSPNPADVKLVQDTLADLGFSVEDTPASGLFVQASGTVAQIRTAFHVTQNLYSYKGKTLRANAEAPVIPARLASVVTFIGGLTDAHLLVKPHHRRITPPLSTPPSAASLSSTLLAPAPNAVPPPYPGFGFFPCSTYWDDHSASLDSPRTFPYGNRLPWAICGYTPQQLRAAYGLDTVSLTGRGVRVAITDIYASPTIVQDVNRFSARHGLPRLNHSNFKQIVPPGIYDVPADDPCGPQGWYEEESIDVEQVHAIAPGAFILYAGDTCSSLAPLGKLYEVIDHKLADVITNSWGNGSEDVPAGMVAATDAEFMQAAIEGITLMFSSGDFGDLTVFNPIATSDYPADSPYVVAVGGTSLALKNRSGEKSEWGWGTYLTSLDNPRIEQNGKVVTDTGWSPFTFDAGSGGGVSVLELQPFYQEGVVPPSLSEHTVLANGKPVTLPSPTRVTPDISMLADPETGILLGETYTLSGDTVDPGCVRTSKSTEYCELGGWGGTSVSSPEFAGIVAVADEEALAIGLGTAGWMNPLLYSLPVGEPGSNAPIIDVKPPREPTAVLVGFLGVSNFAEVAAINSAPNADCTTVIEGIDTSLKTSGGYDNVTGLGTPNVSVLMDTVSHLDALRRPK